MITSFAKLVFRLVSTNSIKRIVPKYFQLSLKDAENRDQQNDELIRQLRQELGQSREQIIELETKLETMIETPKLESRRTSIVSVTL